MAAEVSRQPGILCALQGCATQVAHAHRDVRLLLPPPEYRAFRKALYARAYPAPPEEDGSTRAR